ncbi:MAG TPA: hypothetical protein VLA10_04100 [Ilumatobacter sp.]|nr:hypothetical protein [Ilumatobacter sp.]
MPTAAVYRTIASRLDSCRDSVSVLLRSLSVAGEASPFAAGGDRGGDRGGGRGGGDRDGDGRASAGLLERTVTTTLEVTTANLTEIAAELDRQIIEARHRAVVCDRYTEAVRLHLASTDPRSTFPQRPASWADHGW